jgi:predicted nucleic acid-binding protein
VVSAVVLLDSGPLGLLCNPKNSRQPVACRQWVGGLQAASRRVIIPEIADYEVRRELLRTNLCLSVALLDLLPQQLEYLPLTTAAMRRAAELWAQARQQGQPTAGDNTIDADMILAAQALTLGEPDIIIATTNVGHLSRFVPADLWTNIPP